MEGYVITTHLIDNPKITFYYKGTAHEDGVSFAMNTIVGFDISDAMAFHDKEDAVQLCEKLNEEQKELFNNGYTGFEIIKTCTAKAKVIPALSTIISKKECYKSF